MASTELLPSTAILFFTPPGIGFQIYSLVLKGGGGKRDFRQSTKEYKRKKWATSTTAVIYNMYKNNVEWPIMPIEATTTEEDI